MKIKEGRGADTADVRLDRLSPTEWRVCDRTLDEDDHLSILGFIEEVDGRFEVLRMSAPRRRESFPSLEQAREAFALFSRRRIHTA